MPFFFLDRLMADTHEENHKCKCNVEEKDDADSFGKGRIRRGRGEKGHRGIMGDRGNVEDQREVGKYTGFDRRIFGSV